jgi:membrane protease YdiL (CAAX protease family)
MKRLAPADASYWSATRHPWSCVLFVLPLIAVYELGLRGFGPLPAAVQRNGAEVWLREGLASVGIAPAYGAPCLLLFIMLGWGCVRRAGRPTDHAGVWAGMAIESALFGFALLALSQGMSLLVVRTSHLFAGHISWTNGWLLSWPQPALPNPPEPALELIVRYLGAGIYEETLFRLLIFAGLLALFTLAEFPSAWGFLFAASISALLFAAAHHFGPHGEPYHGLIFTFRTCAGLFFAWLYQARGFGIAVGAHAFYDVLVGLVVR